MNRIFIAIVSILTFWGLFPLTGSAQPPNSPAEDPRIRNFIAWKLVDYLQLTEDQSSKLFPLWRDYTTARSDIQRQRRQLYRKIETAVQDSTISNDDLLGFLKEYRSSEENELKQRENFFRNTRKILDDRQYVKLYTFDDRLLEEFMRNFNRGGGGAGAGAGVQQDH